MQTKLGRRSESECLRKGFAHSVWWHESLSWFNPPLRHSTRSGCCEWARSM